MAEDNPIHAAEAEVLLLQLKLVLNQLAQPRVPEVEAIVKRRLANPDKEGLTHPDHVALMQALHKVHDNKKRPVVNIPPPPPLRDPHHPSNFPPAPPPSPPPTPDPAPPGEPPTGGRRVV